MSAWNGKGAPSGSPEFVHVDAPAASSSASGTTDKSSGAREREQKGKTSNSNQRGRGGTQTSSSSNGSTNWQSIINRLTDQTIPEDQAAIRRLGEDVRKAGSSGARAAVDALRARILDKNATAENRVRSIAVARVLAQRGASGTEAQRFIAAPPFVSALKTVASDPNVRASLKTWASQIRIGDPNDASELAPVTGLDEHLAQAGEPAGQAAPRRPPATTPGTASFQGRPHLATTEEEPDEELRQGVRAHVTGGGRAPGELFGAPMPGGFGLDGTAFDANGSVVGGAPGSVREFPPSSIQSIPPHLLGGRPGAAGPRPGWGEEDEGVQSDAPSTRSKRTTKSMAPSIQLGFGGPTPSMDGGRAARDRLNERGVHQERGRSTRSSSLVDGTLSDPESPAMPGRRLPRGPQPASILDPHMYPQRGPPPQAARPRRASVSPDRNQFRSRSPSPSTPVRSRRQSRARAQSRRRPAAVADPAVMLINLAGVQFVRVIQEYYATREDELSLREGDVLAIIRREEDGRYWLGHSQGRVGRFPAHVVELLSHQTRNPGDSAAQEEKTAELLRRSREIDDFMDQLHDFDITRYCITEDADIQNDLSGLLALRNEVVRHLDDTTTGIGRLKSMLNKIREAQRVHDRMIDSRIAGYTARTALHDATPRINFQELPNNAAFQYTAPFDMAQYVRRTAATVPQQIEQAPARPSIAQPTYNDQRGYGNPAATLRYRQAQDMGFAPRAGPGVMPPRARTYSYTPAAPGPRSPEEPSSAYLTEPSTPGETSGPDNQPGVGPVNGVGAMNGRFAFPSQQPHDVNQPVNGGGWGERAGARKDEVETGVGPGRVRGGSHVASETSAHTHTSRRDRF